MKLIKLFFVLMILLFSCQHVYAEDSVSPQEGTSLVPIQLEVNVQFMGTQGFRMEFLTSQNINENQKITLYYSYDGVNYSTLSNFLWWTDSCFFIYNPDIPVKDYFSKKVDTIYYKLRIEENESSYFTNIDIVTRTQNVASTDLPSIYSFLPIYDVSVRKSQFRPYKVWGQYNFTITETTTIEEAQALLPNQVLVQLQFFDENSEIMWLESIYYDVEWPIINSVDEVINGIQASKITPPSDYKIKLQHGVDDPVYHLNDMNLMTLPTNQPLQATAYLYDPIYDAVLLSERTELDETTNLLLTFPTKPSGAKSITVEYTVDNGKTWIAIDKKWENEDLLSPFNQREFTISFINYLDYPYKDVLNNKLDGFTVRALVQGGVLDGYTNEMAWPADYVYHPPTIPNNDGSSGNRGDVGSENGLESDEDGQRPTISKDEENDDIVQLEDTQTKDKNDQIEDKNTEETIDEKTEDDLNISADTILSAGIVIGTTAVVSIIGCSIMHFKKIKVK